MKATAGSLPIDASLREAVATDLHTLALLHDREPDHDTLEELRTAAMQEWFGLRLRSEVAREGLRLLDEALDSLPRELDREALDQLAVEYANIYLLFTYRAAPTESPWLDKENLERQAPMFEVRRWYRNYRLAAEDWRRRSDDHLVLELRFLAHLCAQTDSDSALRDAARFIDAHLLRWVPQFAGRVASRCEASYYRGLALLTAGYLDELRELLVELIGEARAESKDDKVPTDEVPTAYVPGTGLGW